MSSRYTDIVWQMDELTPPQKLVMLAIAEAADMRGRSSISIREIARLVGVSKTRVQAIIDHCEAAQFLKKMDTGNDGANACKYKIICGAEQSFGHVERTCIKTEWAVDKTQPDRAEIDREEEPSRPQVQPQATPPRAAPSEPVGPKAPADTPLSSAHVQQVLSVAGVSAPGNAPFYWNRLEHVADLTAILAETGASVTRLCEAIAEAKGQGREVDGAVTRLYHLAPLYGGQT